MFKEPQDEGAENNSQFHNRKSIVQTDRAILLEYIYFTAHSYVSESYLGNVLLLVMCKFHKITRDFAPSSRCDANLTAKWPG